jgi:hypothetical protein
VPDGIAAPEPVETEAGALDTPRLTSVDLDVFAEPALTPSGELLPDEDEPSPPEAAAPPPRRVFDDPPSKPQEVVMGSAQGLPMIQVAHIEDAPAAPAPRSAAAGSHYQPPAVALNDSPRVPEWTQQVRETPFKLADHARPAPRMNDEERLQYVRDLLVDTLRRDSLLFASFSLGRVRSAVTQKDLIKLVWEVERDRAHGRRNREQLLNLQRARELLGMGNTLVAGDSQPGVSSEY